jgi:chemotaxis regulatin CheY-phosphate phosphatase CheZ
MRVGGIARTDMTMSVPHIAGITDAELIVYAMREAQSILAQYIERSPQDAEETITQLLDILDRQDIVAATDGLCREYGLRPLK